LGAVYAGAGRLNVIAVALVGFLAAALGDNIGFAIGHLGGRPLIERYGRYVLTTPERLEKATEFFKRHGARVVVVARFVEGLRQANGIVAGVAEMRWTRFLVFQRNRSGTVGGHLDGHRLRVGQPHRRHLRCGNAL
jgi:membrane protein DedA with SNARE-associated domain